MNGEITHLCEFGKFRLDTQKKTLWHDGISVPMPLKELELLCVLIENRGELVTKEELLNKVWEDSFVEESNLSRHIYLLRQTFKEFGENEDLIQNIARRGYRFTGDVCEAINGEVILEKYTVTRTQIEIQENKDRKNKLRSDVFLSTRYRLAASLAGLLLVFVGIIAFWNYRNSGVGTSASEIKSIAVLPLKALSENPDDKALSLGFADALVTSLGTVNEVHVVSANAVNRHADMQKEPVEIGKDLGVDSVLDGTLQRANGKLRVTLRLIRMSDGMQIWSSSFDESESEIFKLQDTMAAETAQSLKWNLSAEDRRNIAKRYTENRDAYQAYLRGRFFFDKRNSENYEKAINEFERAVSLDPGYALAYTGLADVYALQAINNSGEARDALYEKARAKASKALQLDETLAEAHTSMGWIHRIHDWNWESSEKQFKRAIELNPNYANAHQWYALLLTTLGRSEEAHAEIAKAVALEPYSTVIFQNYFAVRLYSREYDLLPGIVQRAATLEPDANNIAKNLSMVYFRQGEYSKVIEIGEDYLAKTGNKNGDNSIITILAAAYVRTGQETKARRRYPRHVGRNSMFAPGSFLLGFAGNDDA